MADDQIEQIIVDYGTKAVLRYRDVAALDDDNFIPEIFLGSFIANGLHDELGLNAHVERYYTVIANELGVAISAELTSMIGGYRADVAVYEGRKPKAIIELKLFGDGNHPASIVADSDKMAKLAAVCDIGSYIGVLVTDTARVTCIDRVRQVGEALGHEFISIGQPQLSKDGLWRWCFAAAKFQPA